MSLNVSSSSSTWLRTYQSFKLLSKRTSIENINDFSEQSTSEVWAGCALSIFKAVATQPIYRILELNTLDQKDIRKSCDIAKSKESEYQKRCEARMLKRKRWHKLSSNYIWTTSGKVCLSVSHLLPAETCLGVWCSMVRSRLNGALGRLGT